MKVTCDCCKQEVRFLLVDGMVRWTRCACVIPPSIPLEVIRAARDHFADPNAVGSLCSLDPKCYERVKVIPCPHHVERPADDSQAAGAPSAQQPLHDPANNAGVATGSRNGPASESVTRGSLPPLRPGAACNACGKPLLLMNLFTDDGCPCNSPRGVNLSPQACAICNTGNCVKPGHHIKEIFGFGVQPPPSADAWPSIEAVCRAATSDDPAFATWRNAVPDKHWVRLDLSALRVGFELGKAVAARISERGAPC